VFWTSAIGVYILTVNFNVIPTSKLFNWVLYLGYVKIYISVIKYIPQVYMNYIRKSTIGWSIFNIILDFTGGFFSVL